MDKENGKNGSHKEDAFPTASLPDSSAVIGGEIGPYKLLSVLGEGGFGIVYLAEQKQPIKRQVALKIIKPGMDSKQVIARFEAERQALAMLDHPNIARVFEVGSTEAGHPYFVMEYIKGMPITDYCDHYQLKIEERLKLFIQVCEAIQHAHQKGIIHRDIKPSNIVVSFQDGKAVPKVIDFGVAKAIGMPLTDKTIFTQQGQLIGTPEYMSPEQADLKEKDIDTRTDIYSLGVVLYELLAGTLPFEPRTLREAGYAEIQRIIREQEPPRPSTKLSSLGEDAAKVARNRHTEISTLVKNLHKELEWIPLKAIRKERDHRYKTASDLAEDVQNYLDGNPLAAGPESAGYRFHKFVRRHQGLVATLTAIAALTIVSLFIITTLYLQAEKAKNETKRQLYYNRIALADASKINDVNNARQLLESCPQDLRGWEWDWLYYNLDRSLFTISGYSNKAKLICFSPDTKLFASVDIDNTIIVWDADIGNRQMVLGNHREDILSICFSPDSKRIVFGSNDGSIKIWDMENVSKTQNLSNHQDSVCSICFSPDGKRIASGSKNGSIKIWDANNGAQIQLLPQNSHQDNVHLLCFSPDGRRIASGSDYKVILWDVDSGKQLLTQTKESLFLSLCFSPDGKRFASGNSNKTIRVWDADGGHAVLILIGHQSGVSSLCFSPDGKQIASGSWDKTIKLWDTDTGNELLTLSGHQSSVLSVNFSPDGKRIASASSDYTMKLWDTATVSQVLTLHGLQNRIVSLCFSPDGRQIASAGDDNTIELWNTDNSSRQMILSDHQKRIRSLAFSPDGKCIASASDDTTIKIWNTTDGSCMHTLNDHHGNVYSICFSPDGRKIVSGSADNSIKVWDVDSTSPILSLYGHEHGVYFVCFSPDGKQIASGGVDGTIKLWDTATGNQQMTLKDHKKRIRSLSFSPDGKQIASASDDSTINLWNTGGGGKLQTLRGHKAPACAVSFSPDGKRIISGGWDKTCKLWDADTGRELLTLSDHQGLVLSACFSPDGKRIVSGGIDNTAIIWDTSIKEVRPPIRYSQKTFVDNNTFLYPVWEYIQTGKPDEASQLVEDLQISEEPNALEHVINSLVWAYDNRANVYWNNNDYANAINDCETILCLQPDHVKALNSLAWLQATCPIAELRDGGKAVEIATRACELTNWKDPMYLDTLAAAYSQVGDFNNAIKWQKEAIFLLPKDELQNKDYEIRLKLYMSGIAYSEPMTKELVGWWKLENVQNGYVIDSSGQGHNGKLIGDAKIVPDPQRGNVLRLDGDGDYVDCGNDPVFDITGTITVSCWIRIAKFDKPWQAIVTKGDFSWRLACNHNASSLEFACRGLKVQGADYGSIVGHKKVDDDLWHHIVGVYDGEKLYLWIDGILDKSVNASGLIDVYNDRVMIGENATLLQPRYYSPRSFIGLIDDVRIYNYALNENEIKAIYENKEPPSGNESGK